MRFNVPEKPLSFLLQRIAKTDVPELWPVAIDPQAVCAYNCRLMSRRRPFLIAARRDDVDLAAGVWTDNPSWSTSRSVDPTIVIDLRYATDQNVTGHALYPRGTRAMVLPSVAQQLAGAQTLLKQFNYRLKIWDAYRPEGSAGVALEICGTRTITSRIPRTGFGSMHSWGVSVDATLVDDWSQDVTMPTEVRRVHARRR